MAMNCLNHLDSVISCPFNDWTLSILHLLKRRGLFLTAKHITRIQNVVADGLSRLYPLPSEWMLDHQFFDWVLGLRTQPQVDFTTRENYHLLCYVYSVLDEQATALDAFSVDWKRWGLIYLFPPANVILKVLNLLESYVGNAVLLTPCWPNQQWYLLLFQRASAYQEIPQPGLSQIMKGEVCWNLSRFLPANSYLDFMTKSLFTAIFQRFS